MIHQITTQIAPITNHQFYIQAALILAVIAAGWMMLRTPGGARHQAARRLATLAFVVFAIVAIAFLAQILSSFRRNSARERQITHLARRIALDNAPEPPAATRLTSTTHD